MESSTNPQDKYIRERIGERENAIIKEERWQKRKQQFKNKKYIEYYVNTCIQYLHVPTMVIARNHLTVSE